VEGGSNGYMTIGGGERQDSSQYLYGSESQFVALGWRLLRTTTATTHQGQPADGATAHYNRYYAPGPALEHPLRW
jgi:hypothetical protein